MTAAGKRPKGAERIQKNFKYFVDGFSIVVPALHKYRPLSFTISFAAGHSETLPCAYKNVVLYRFSAICIERNMKNPNFRVFRSGGRKKAEKALAKHRFPLHQRHPEAAETHVQPRHWCGHCIEALRYIKRTRCGGRGSKQKL